MTLYFKTKLNTTKAIGNKLKVMAGTYRRIFNVAMETQWDLLFASKGYDPYITGTELKEMLIDSRREFFPYVKKMDGGILTSAAFRSNESFKRWWENYNWKGYRRPRFLSRKKDKMTFKTSGKVRIFYDYIEVPKLGKIKLYEKGYIPQGKTYSNITFSHDGESWWISLEVKEETSVPSNENYEGEGVLDVNCQGDISLNGKKLINPILTEEYLKAERKKKKLEKKLRRQSLANIEVNHRGKKTRTSRNMLKTRKLISKVNVRLENIRKDSFKKQACAIARTKLKKLYCLSPLAIKEERGGVLSRLAREKHALDFYNMIKKRVALEGTCVEEHGNLLCKTP